MWRREGVILRDLAALLTYFELEYTVVRARESTLEFFEVSGDYLRQLKPTFGVP